MISVSECWESLSVGKIDGAVHDFADCGCYGANVMWLIEESLRAVPAVTADAGWWGYG